MTATTLTFPGGTHQDHSRANAFLEGLRRVLLMVFFWFGLPILWTWSFWNGVKPEFYLYSAVVYAVAYGLTYAFFRIHPFMNYWSGEVVIQGKSAPKPVPAPKPAPAATAPAPKPKPPVTPAPAPSGEEQTVTQAFSVNAEGDTVVATVGGEGGGDDVVVEEIEFEEVEVSTASAFQLGSRAEKSLTKSASHLEKITELLKSRRDSANNLFELFEVLEQYRKVKDNIEKAAAEFEAGVRAGCDLAVLLPIVDRIEKYEREVAGLVQTIAKALENVPTVSATTPATKPAEGASAVDAAIGLEDDPNRLNQRIEQIREVSRIIDEFDRLQSEFPEPSKEAVEVSTLVATAQAAQEQADVAIQNGLIKVVQAAETKNPTAAKAVITGAKGNLSHTRGQFELAEQAVETIDGLMEWGDTSELEGQLETAQSNVRDLNRRVIELEGNLRKAKTSAASATVTASPAASAPTAADTATPPARVRKDGGKSGKRRYAIASDGGQEAPDPEDSASD